MKRQTRAYILAILAVLCWSTVASAFKLTLRSTDPLTMLFWSSLSSTLFLFLCRLARGERSTLLPPFDRKNMWRASLINGCLNPFLYYMLLFPAYSLLPAQEAQPLNYTWPVMVVLLSAPMLGQKIRPLGLAAIGISFFGVLVISTHGDPLSFRFTSGPGAALAISSSIVWAFYWLRNVRDTRGALEKLSVNFLFGTLFVLIAMLVTRRSLTVSLPALLGSLYIGVFEMGLAFLLWLKALSLSETSARVSNLVFLSPFLSLLFIRQFVGETILPSSVIGLAIIVLGIFIQKRA